MFNTDAINNNLNSILGWSFVALAIFVVIRGRRAKISESGSMVLIGLFALILVAMGGLVGTTFGQNILTGIFNTGTATPAPNSTP